MVEVAEKKVRSAECGLVTKKLITKRYLKKGKRAMRRKGEISDDFSVGQKIGIIFSASYESGLSTMSC
jgi:hypothetical protein